MIDKDNYNVSELTKNTIKTDQRTCRDVINYIQIC